MPYLKTILMNATDKSKRMLRAKSMECISLVGMAVGKDKFKEDARQVCLMHESIIFKIDAICCNLIFVLQMTISSFLFDFHLSNENIFHVYSRSWKFLCHCKGLKWRQMIQ